MKLCGEAELLRSVIAVFVLCGLLVCGSRADDPSTNGPPADKADAASRLPTIVALERTAKPLLVSDQPHESFCLAYLNVLHDGERWRMWYTAYDHSYRDDGDAYLCYAESRDGVTWQKPALGLVEHAGKRSNNIIVAGRTIGGLHGATVFNDPLADTGERYKIVFTRLIAGKWAVCGGRSADGIRWQWIEKPLLAENSDTQTVCFVDGNEYRLYVRMWTGGDYKGLRTVGYAGSSTFEKFPRPEQIFAPDAHDPPKMDFYNSAATKLADNLYVMFPSAFYRDRDTLAVHAAVSRDGKHFGRQSREPLLSPGKGFDSMGLYVAPGAVAGPQPHTWWFYYLGTSVGHDQNWPSKVRRAGGYGRFLVSVE